MKREGRQHGMVRSYQILPVPWDPRSERRFVNQVDSTQTAGLFTKVSQKPTNHSKFTGKCRHPRCAGCHIHPARKAKDKAKGTQKLRSCDVASNHRLVSWRAVDSKPGLTHFPGHSASGMLDYLANDSNYDDNYYDEDYHDTIDNEIRLGSILAKHHGIGVDVQDGKNDVDVHDDVNVQDDDDDDDNDKMSFCDVGLCWDHGDGDGDEGWYMVGEM